MEYSYYCELWAKKLKNIRTELNDSKWRITIPILTYYTSILNNIFPHPYPLHRNWSVSTVSDNGLDDWASRV
jgi:hypothetical protein